MKPTIARVALFVAGFAVWAAFSIVPGSDGGFTTREAWDSAPYWEFGVPLLAAAQAISAAASREKLLQLPVWPLAGHFLGMFAIHRAGADFALVPLAFVFIGVPGYFTLLAVSVAARKFAGRFA
ncbi:MAG TPA: hypothetical protein VGM72_02410 [Micropepsaceae bacterium]